MFIIFTKCNFKYFQISPSSSLMLRAPLMMRSDEQYQLPWTKSIPSNKKSLTCTCNVGNESKRTRRQCTFFKLSYLWWCPLFPLKYLSCERIHTTMMNAIIKVVANERCLNVGMFFLDKSEFYKYILHPFQYTKWQGRICMAHLLVVFLLPPTTI